MTVILNRQTMAGSSGITVKPIEAGLGADILGLDFAAVTPDQAKAVRAAWLEHGVLRFRGYDFSDEQHLDFTRLFGDFVKHPQQMKGAEGAHPVYEEILVISNAKVDGKLAGTMGNSEANWHTDTWFYERPPAGALLHALQLPSAGGDTYFANMYSVYEHLPAAVRRIIEGRLMQFDIVYDGAGRVRAGQQAPDTDDIRLWPHVRHPIVRTHGESGRNCVYIGAESRVKGSWIVGLPLDESAAIHAEILDLVKRTEFQFRQVWQDGDMIMWDNRCTMHRRDSWSAAEIRIMHRTTTTGERPFYKF
jgi:taurine dioxygenase